MNIEKARFNMIEQQVKPWNVFDDRLLGAMSTIPRELFLPESYRAMAYADIQIPLGQNQQALAPREIARMIQALKLKGDEKVLEVGCGSGYATALLAKLCHSVYSVDIIGDFVESAKQRLAKLAFDNVQFEEIDANEGWAAHSPYDAIIITSLMHQWPESIIKTLSESGRIVGVLGRPKRQHAVLGYFDKQNQWTQEMLFPIQSTPLINAPMPSEFEF